MISKKIKQTALLFSLSLLMSSSAAFAQEEYGYSNNWYVGDTQAGEWIKHKKVWLASGNYRFTTRVVAPAKGKTVALELNDKTVFSGVEVPADRSGKFHLAHLGSMYIEAGYYDVKLVFETGDVNCDMIFIKKDDRTDKQVLNTDIEYTLNHDDGMHIAPISGSAGASGLLAKAGDQGDAVDWYFQADPANGITYTREQMIQWNKQQMYTYHLEYSQEYMDILAQELAESKVDFIWAHGRGEPDTENQIVDRDFKTGAGSMPCRGLDILVDAINRNPYTRNNLKIAYFFDNAAPYTSAGMSEFYTGPLDYASDEFRNFMWEFAVKKWYQTIPREMLYTIPDGAGKGRTIVPMQWWTAGFGVKWGSRGLEFKSGEGMDGFFNYLRDKMLEEFDLTVAWVLDNSFFNHGGDAVRYLAWGTQAWFEWGKNNTEIKEFGGKKFAFALNGGRQPLHQSVLGDWDPYTNEGTYTAAHKGTHMNALDENNELTIRQVYEDGTDQNAEWLVLESWGDWMEGSTWYRSGHREYAYPNQPIALCREFADKECTSILLEAESCDEFYDKSKGNSGGAYRLDWYRESELKKEYWDANLEVDLDIFRPLHQLSEIVPQYTKQSETYESIYAGFRDVWVINSQSRVYANEIDGYPLVAWKQITNNLAAQKVVLGGFSAWAINTSGSVVRCTLPNQQWANVNNGWQAVDGKWSSAGGWLEGTKVPVNSGDYAKVEGEIKIKDIDANNAMIWGVDTDNNIYYRNFNCTRPWVRIEGKLTSIVVDEVSGWGFDPDGNLKRFSLQSKSDWRTIQNPYNLKKISANCEEVWGVNDKNEIYRISSSGYGSWQLVATGYKDVSVGTNYVWFLDLNGLPHKCDLTSFTEYSVFTSVDPLNIQEEKATTNQVKVYPNPSKEEIKLSITADKEEEIRISVNAVDGSLIYQDKLNIVMGINEYDLSNALSSYPSGIYLLTVYKKSGKEVVKLIRQ